LDYWRKQVQRPGERAPPHAPGGEAAMAKRVLVVDDEPNIVLSLEFLMRRAGFEVQVARSGGEALKALEGEPPDLMLLDVMMPEFDGYEVCERIRANPAWRRTKIVMLTARGREAERERGLALGADAYVTKPFSTRELVDQVKRMLEVV
jgi:DNA-binding response OmpR family regulator